MKKIFLVFVLLVSFLSAQAISLKQGYNFGVQCEQYGLSPFTISKTLMSMRQNLSAGNYSQAYIEGTAMAQIFENYPLLRNYEHYGSFCYNYGLVLTNTGKISEAINYFRKSEKFWKEAKGTDSYEYVLSLLWLTDCYMAKGDIFSAKHYLEEAEKCQIKDKDAKDKYIVTKVLMLRHSNRDREALDLIKTFKNPGENIKSLRRTIQLSLGQRDEVLAEMQKEYKSIKKISDKELGFLNQYAIVLSGDSSTLQEAIKIGSELTDYYRTHNLISRPEYVWAMQSLGIYNMWAGDYAEAQKLLERVHGLLGIYHSGDALKYITLLPVLQHAGYLNGDMAKAQEAAQDNLFIEKQILALNMLRPEDERRNYWASNGDWFVSELPKVALNVNDSAMWADCYDALLAGKGMVSYSDKVFGEIADKNGGPLKESYDEYVKLNNLLKEETDFDKYSDLTDLRDAAFDRFAKECKDNPEFRKRFSFSWKDVAESLQPGESAVEFFSYKDKDGVGHYAAAVIPKKGVSPQVVYLISETELNDIDAKEKPDNIARLIWNPLEKYIGESSKVYFSPAGNLYVTPIEYTDEKSRQYVRLTSTRMLQDRNLEEGKNEDMVLYGGLTYRMTPGSMMAEHSKYPARRDFEINNWRQGALNNITPLENTLTEVEEIAGLVSSSLLKQPVIYSGKEGVEESFKALSGNSPSVLHIATHGFFIDEKEKSGNIDLTSNTLPLIPSNNNVMQRSGLLLSGANKAFAEGEAPEGVDDGILTALEISELDLAGTRLAVLSACETGLGSISGDGVAGLQSAFKQAGVDQLIISLWKVDDKATSELMKEFYRHWIVEGKSKREALTQAQNFIRTNPEHEEWKNPEYWAAFILLDEIQ